MWAATIVRGAFAQLVVPEPRFFAAACTRVWVSGCSPGRWEGTRRPWSTTLRPSDHGLLAGDRCGAVRGQGWQYPGSSRERGLLLGTVKLLPSTPRPVLGAASKAPGLQDSGYRSVCFWEEGTVR